MTGKVVVITGGASGIGRATALAFARQRARVVIGDIEKVSTLKKQGKSLDEIVATKPTAPTDAKWGGGFMSPRQFIGLVFQGV